MLWLPLYLKNDEHQYSDYEMASATATLDIGNLIGAVLIGYLTDLTYSRRTPIAVVSILLATILEVFLMFISP